MKRKKALSLLLALLIAAGIPMGSLAAWEDPFTDVRAGDWFYGAVKYVNTAGLFHGTAPHAFSPETPMTRGMFVTVLGKASNVDTPSPAHRARFSGTRPAGRMFGELLLISADFPDWLTGMNPLSQDNCRRNRPRPLPGK